MMKLKIKKLENGLDTTPFPDGSGPILGSFENDDSFYLDGAFYEWGYGADENGDPAGRSSTDNTSFYSADDAIKFFEWLNPKTIEEVAEALWNMKPDCYK